MDFWPSAASGLFLMSELDLGNSGHQGIWTQGFAASTCIKERLGIAQKPGTFQAKAIYVGFAPRIAGTHPRPCADKIRRPGCEKATEKARSKEPALAQHLDPSSLVLPANLFITNDGRPLPQLPIDEVHNARGVAFVSAEDAQHFLADGKLISLDGLALVVVGSMPESTTVSLPMHTLRVPAIYKGTNEPI